MYAVQVEIELAQFMAASFGVADAGLLVASLGADELAAGPVEVVLARVQVIRERMDENVRGLVNLADRDEGIFPPEAARFGERGRGSRSS